MTCDIHSYAERKAENGKWESVHGIKPFSNRNYGTFGFLAGVRNYSDIKPIAEPRGFPNDVIAKVVADYDAWPGDAHTPSWLSVAELTGFDYDAICEDRRVTRQDGTTLWNGGCTCAPGEGKEQTYREFLGPRFFDDLKALQDAGAERVVFWFDN